MRIIFQNGEVAEVHNIDRIICRNAYEAMICRKAIHPKFEEDEHWPIFHQVDVFEWLSERSEDHE